MVINSGEWEFFALSQTKEAYGIINLGWGAQDRDALFLGVDLAASEDHSEAN